MNKKAIRSILPWIALGAIATVGLVYISDGPWQMYIYVGIGVILVSIRYIMDAQVEKESQQASRSRLYFSLYSGQRLRSHSSFPHCFAIEANRVLMLIANPLPNPPPDYRGPEK